MHTDIRQKTIAQYANDVKTGSADVTSKTDWTSDGWRQTFFTGFWQLFGERIKGGSLKLDALRCADVLDTCSQIRGINLVVDNFLTENFSNQKMDRQEPGKVQTSNDKLRKTA